MHRRRLLQALAAGGLAGPLSAAVAPEPYAPLKLYRNRLYVPARIAGAPAEALLDSAAELTLIDRAFARRAGLAVGAAATVLGSGAGNAQSEIVEHVRIETLGLSNPDGVVAVLDLSDVARRLTGGTLDVILGRNVFDLARLEIDIAGGRIRVLDRRLRPRGRELALTGAFGVETIPVLAEGQPAAATLDLGNGTDVLISRAFAQRLGALEDGRPIHDNPGGGIGGKAHRQGFTLKTIDLAGRRFRNVSVAIDAGEHATDLNIGVSLLKHFHLVTDFARKTVWLAPS